jgi:hypothetical protein
VSELSAEQKERHHTEIHHEQWPVDLDVHAIEEGQEDSKQSCAKHALPEVHLAHFALETLVLCFFRLDE